MWAVMCCQCYRFLGHNGEVAGQGAPLAQMAAGGYIDTDQLAEFITKEAGDARATAAGWKITKEDGHRCPACVKHPQSESGRGAHVWVGEPPP